LPDKLRILFFAAGLLELSTADYEAKSYFVHSIYYFLL